jgi:hypothetical protein
VGAATAGSLRAARAGWRAFTWRVPDWWLGAASVAAWIGLGAMFLAMASGSAGHAGHRTHGSPLIALHPMSTGEMLAAWAAMVVAMMLPLVRGQARWLALRSLRRLRQGAVAVFAGAFVLVWALAGAGAVVALEPVRGEAGAVALALAVAAAWHGAPARRRLLRRCAAQRAPAVRGARAVAGWGRAGALAGGRCVATCWALMLPMAIAHHPALMAGTALVLLSERRRGPNPELHAAGRLQALAIAAAAVAVAGFAAAA